MEKILGYRKEMTLEEFITELENDWGFARVNGTQSIAEILMEIIPSSDSEKKVDVTFTLWSNKQEVETRFVMRWIIEGYVPHINWNLPRCIEVKSDGFVISTNTRLV
jgi:hypothetical protein